MSNSRRHKHRAEKEQRIDAALTTDSLDKPVQNHSFGDFIEPHEQSEADSHSFVSFPNRVRSDCKNDYHDKETKSGLNLIARLGVLPFPHTFHQAQPNEREP